MLVVLHGKKITKMYIKDILFKILNNRIKMVCLFKWIATRILGRQAIIIVEFEKCSAPWVWERD